MCLQNKVNFPLIFVQKSIIWFEFILVLCEANLKLIKFVSSF